MHGQKIKLRAEAGECDGGGGTGGAILQFNRQNWGGAIKNIKSGKLALFTIIED